MDTKDERFKKFNHNYDIVKHFAEILADIVKNKASSADKALWDSVPEISADSECFDIVKDFSIRGHEKRYISDLLGYGDLGGQVGLVLHNREITKRDGRTAVQVEIVFYPHTNRSEPRYRNVEFIKG
jgi:hypothetical protein